MEIGRPATGAIGWKQTTEGWARGGKGTRSGRESVDDLEVGLQVMRDSGGSTMHRVKPCRKIEPIDGIL